MEHGENADGDLLISQALHNGVGALQHVGHQVPVGELYTLGNSRGPRAVRKNCDVFRLRKTTAKRIMKSVVDDIARMIFITS